jgi:nucleoid DNA-binding protein
LDFAKHIKQLLHLNDCVILPGFGGFVANYRPARFDEARSTASPPSKYILFNRDLVHNDGLLYAHVSAETGYGYKEVEKLAIRFIDGIRKDIRGGGKALIGGIGYFYLDRENQIQFTEEEGNNYLLESYGLPFLHYREFEQSPARTYRTLATEQDPTARQKRVRRWIYGTAAACLLAALVVVPMKTDLLNQAGIDIPAIDSFRKEQSIKTGITPDTESPGSTAGLDRTKTLMPPPEYNIVVGSFREFGNARQLYNHLVQGGYEARILGAENGFYRVSAGTYSGHDQASADLVAVRRDFENAWILSN